MSDIVIQVDRLSKQYRLGQIGGKRLVDDVNRWWAKLRGKEDPLSKVGQGKAESRKQKAEIKNGEGNNKFQLSTHPISDLRNDMLWALRDVSFEVKQGEVLGIIGRNGAGKSTLLKILSRVTGPTSGEVRVKGRIASLLEVGTGFNPELTGRENIYLNGAILGMTKAEIRGKFDEIVAFSEVEQFIDTPVKRYSSGMTVRLAFAVAAHLEPEILIVDEVLAVGDAVFQKKCIGKMQDVSRIGRTVLFVSHNMAAVKALCTRGVLLKDGAVCQIGETATIVGSYLQGAMMGTHERNWSDAESAPGNETVRLLRVCVCAPEMAPAITIDTGAAIEVDFHCAKAGLNLDCTVYLVNQEGILLFESGCDVSTSEDSTVGTYRLFGLIPPHLLNAGRYYLNVLFGQDQKFVLFKLDEVVTFEVENTATGRGHNMTVAPGVVRPLLNWQYEYSNDAPNRIRQPAMINMSR